MSNRSKVTHAILVRDCGAPGRRFTRILAKDIAGRSEAERIVSRLASSYERHGADPGSRMHWFLDGSGRHELWVRSRA